MILKNEKSIHREVNLETLGKKRKQKGEFLGATVAQVGTELVGCLVNKIFGSRKIRQIRF